MQPLELNQDEASATIWHLAFIHMMAGDADGAIGYLVNGLDAPTWIAVHSLRLSPIRDPLRQEPAFQRLVVR